ncbi:MAG: P-type DNA transfer ATPase VirB11 [Gammaproteobacteria bacterium]
MSIASLETTLKPIRAFLDAPAVSELSINKPNEIWCDNGAVATRVAIPYDYGMLERLAQLTASFNNQIISDAKPILSGTLPGGYRIQIVRAPAALQVNRDGTTSNTISISIRKQTIRDFSVDGYAAGGGLSRVGVHASQQETLNHDLNLLIDQKQYADFLKKAVKAKKTILISGGTYSGKTSVLNMLLKELDPTERIITIEDAAEVVIHNENQVRLFYTRGTQGIASVSAADLITSCLRMRPDRIIMGELRGDDAVHWLAAANSGHEGTLSTIHADTPAMAIEKMIEMVKLVRPGQTDESIRNYITSVIDIIIQIRKDHATGERYISDIEWVKHANFI